MKKVIKSIPIPYAGVMLAFAAGGNLAAKYGMAYKNFFGIISAISLILLTLKVILDFNAVVESLKHPVLSSVMCTYPMGVIVLSTYLIPFNKQLAYSFWIVGIILHFILLGIFTKNHIFNFKIKKVFPSYFIVYVGFVCASVTAPAYGMNSLGKILFYLGFINYLILLPIVFYRTTIIKEIPKPAIPTITIFAAPASLCLAGYMSSFTNKNLTLVSIMLFLSVISVTLVIAYSPKMLKNGFFPSYSAFTFPLVISAIASAKTLHFYLNINKNIKYLITYSNSIIILSFLVNFYVLLKYIIFLNKKNSMDKNISSTKAS